QPCPAPGGSAICAKCSDDAKTEHDHAVAPADRAGELRNDRREPVERLERHRVKDFLSGDMQYRPEAVDGEEQRARQPETRFAPERAKADGAQPQYGVADINRVLEV